MMIMGYSARKYALSRNAVKYIAASSMLVDHLGAALTVSGTASHLIMRMCIGRIAFPLFCFLFAEGIVRTNKAVLHLRDLLLFALLSEPCFDRFFTGQWVDFSKQNIMWCWALSLLLILIIDHLGTRFTDATLQKTAYIVLSVLLIAIGMVTAELLKFDYRSAGIACSLAAYYVPKLVSGMTAGMTAAMTSVTAAFSTYPGALLALPIGLLYDPEKKCGHTWVQKYFFYVFYPMHLLVLCLLFGHAGA